MTTQDKFKRLQELLLDIFQRWEDNRGVQAEVMSTALQLQWMIIMQDASLRGQGHSLDKLLALEVQDKMTRNPSGLVVPQMKINLKDGN